MNPIVKVTDIPENWNPNVVDLVNKLIARKEDTRLGAKGAKSVKNHPWFNDIDWDEIENHRYKPDFVPINVIFYKKILIFYLIDRRLF